MYLYKAILKYNFPNPGASQIQMCIEQHKPASRGGTLLSINGSRGYFNVKFCFLYNFPKDIV